MSSLIKPITSDHDLIELSKQIGVHIDKILSLSEIREPLPKKGTFVILLRADGGVGHWTAVCDWNYFDSMGVGPPTVIGDLPYNEQQYQGTYDEFCGPFCMLWLYTRQHNRPNLLKRFNDLDTDII